MIPVRNAIHRRNSNNIRNFRDIKHSTFSKGLFSGFGAQKNRSVRIQRPKFDGFHFGDFHLPGGYLESKWLGSAVDDAMSKVLQHLASGNVFYGLFGNILAALYRMSRGNIIRFLILLLYRVVVVLLMSLYKILWRLLILPLTIVAVLMLVILLVAML